MSLCDYLIFVCFALSVDLIGTWILLGVLFKMYIDVKAEINTLQLIMEELK